MTDVTECPYGVRIRATARNGDVAAHPLVVKRYPVLAEAIMEGASPSIRNMATVSANLMQRNRCFYFYDLSCAECNKRDPGSGCAALLAQNGMNAVSGDSHHCIAAYPGDMAVALTALDALVIVRGRDRERSIPIDSFYKLPGNSSDLEHDLKTGELIVSVELPHSAATGSCYVKVRDRRSFASGLLSVAAVLEVDPAGQEIREARIAVGTVAPKPWRVRSAEEALRGKEVSEPAFKAAAEIVAAEANPARHNASRLEVARPTVVRALTEAATLAKHAADDVGRRGSANCRSPGINCIW